MTSLGNENVRAPIDKLKQRAYSIQSRMSELGHKIPLTHAYEALATASGYRNWPTMRAMAYPAVSTITIGHGSKLVQENRLGRTIYTPAPDLDKPIKIASEDTRSHFEVRGPSGEDRNGVMAGFMEGAVERGEGLVMFDATGDMSLHHKFSRMCRQAWQKVRLQNPEPDVGDS